MLIKSYQSTESIIRTIVGVLVFTPFITLPFILMVFVLTDLSVISTLLFLVSVYGIALLYIFTTRTSIKINEEGFKINYYHLNKQENVVLKKQDISEIKLEYIHVIGKPLLAEKARSVYLKKRYLVIMLKDNKMHYLPDQKLKSKMIQSLKKYNYSKIHKNLQ